MEDIDTYLKLCQCIRHPHFSKHMYKIINIGFEGYPPIFSNKISWNIFLDHISQNNIFSRLARIFIIVMAAIK